MPHVCSAVKSPFFVPFFHFFLYFRTKLETDKNLNRNVSFTYCLEKNQRPRKTKLKLFSAN